ncbi:MAG TPA: hypothetical protein VMV78_12945 [Thiobacillus sp.]|jgi:hypothetical protein|nr:hypothetical protein [Thiobacillus sp.]
MKQMTMLFLLALTGCASNVALKDAADTTRAVGTLSAWGATHRMEVMLDGKRYEGEWVRNPCTTDACHGIYRNDTLGLHRRHTSKGSKATLESADGERLVCEWVSHLADVKGTCQTQDGHQFRLKAGD